jgi:hypothetical protein
MEKFVVGAGFVVVCLIGYGVFAWAENVIRQLLLDLIF